MAEGKRTEQAHCTISMTGTSREKAELIYYKYPHSQRPLFGGMVRLTTRKWHRKSRLTQWQQW